MTGEGVHGMKGKGGLGARNEGVGVQGMKRKGGKG